MNRVILVIVFLCFINSTISCFAPCKLCTCGPIDSCGQQTCYGQGQQCYCGLAKHNDHIILNKLQSEICNLVNKLEINQFILPVFGNNQTISINCTNDQLFALLLKD